MQITVDDGFGARRFLCQEVKLRNSLAMFLQFFFGDASEEIAAFRPNKAVLQIINPEGEDTFEEIKLQFEIPEIVLRIDVWRGSDHVRVLTYKLRHLLVCYNISK